MRDAMQRDFLDGVTGQAPKVGLGPSHIGAAQTWQIYRRNYLQCHIDALADSYGTVLKLVGDGYFRQLARRYVVHHPSYSGDLNDYGCGFADFLAQLLPTVPNGDALQYLPDVARFDWAWFEVLRAVEQRSDWLAELLALPSERWSQARAHRAPACRYVRSAFPLYRIWRAAEGDDAVVCLDSGGEGLLITRPDAMRVTPVVLAEAAFVGAWLSGSALEEALEGALAEEPDFNLGATLTKLATLGAVKAITLEASAHEQRTPT